MEESKATAKKIKLTSQQFTAKLGAGINAEELEELVDRNFDI